MDSYPLTVGIFEKKTGTVEALFSPRLWSKDGLLTQAGTDTFWDRSTLYALRGVYSAGARERAMEHMHITHSNACLGNMFHILSRPGPKETNGICQPKVLCIAV